MTDKVRVKIDAIGTFLEVDVELFKESKNILNIDDGETIEKCKVFKNGDVWIAIPEAFVIK